MDPSTIAIAEVLRRWYDNEPVVIRFPTPSERLLREARKAVNPTQQSAPTPPRVA